MALATSMANVVLGGGEPQKSVMVRVGIGAQASAACNTHKELHCSALVGLLCEVPSKKPV